MHVYIYVGIHIVVGWNEVMVLYVVLCNSGAIYVSMYECVYAYVYVCMHACCCRWSAIMVLYVVMVRMGNRGIQEVRKKPAVGENVVALTLVTKAKDGTFVRSLDDEDEDEAAATNL